jgi:hypothetical protein
VEFIHSIDPVLLTCSKLVGQNFIMRTFGHEMRDVRTPVPICYHAHCDHHAQAGQTIRHHVEVDHQSDPRPNMGMWDYFVSHIQLRNGAYATIEDLLGEHKVHCCSLCSFTSAVKGGVKRHLQQYKVGQGTEWAATMKPVLVPGIEAIVARGDWHLDAGTTYHRKVKKRSKPKCPVPV